MTKMNLPVGVPTAQIAQCARDLSLHPEVSGSSLAVGCILKSTAGRRKINSPVNESKQSAHSSWGKTTDSKSQGRWIKTYNGQ